MLKRKIQSRLEKEGAVRKIQDRILEAVMMARPLLPEAVDPTAESTEKLKSKKEPWERAGVRCQEQWRRRRRRWHRRHGLNVVFRPLVSPPWEATTHHSPFLLLGVVTKWNAARALRLEPSNFEAVAFHFIGVSSKVDRAQAGPSALLHPEKDVLVRLALKRNPTPNVSCQGMRM
jgi:hypothetical protein